MSVREGIMVTEYRIIGRSSEAELVRDVNSAIKEGWRPQGGVCCHLDRDRDSIWAQAMTREVK